MTHVGRKAGAEDRELWSQMQQAFAQAREGALKAEAPGIAKRANVQAMGFVGNEAYANQF